MRTFAFVAFFLGLMVLGNRAYGEGEEAPKQRYESGLRKYHLGRFGEAAADFEAAYEQTGDPTLLFNVAQAFRQAGNYGKALFFYKAYLSAYDQRGEEAPQRAAVEARIEEVSRKLAAAEMTPPAPAPKAEEPPPERSTSSTENTPSTAKSSSARESSVATPKAGRPAPRALRASGLALASVGGAALVVGGVMSGLVVSASNDVQNARGEFNAGLKNREHAGQAYQAASIGLYVAGGVLVAAGVVPLVLSYRHPQKLAIVPSVSPGFIGLAAGGRF